MRRITIPFPRSRIGLPCNVQALIFCVAVHKNESFVERDPTGEHALAAHCAAQPIRLQIAAPQKIYLTFVP